MTQPEINAAVKRLLEGHNDALQLIRDGVTNGEIVVQASNSVLRLRAKPRDLPITHALRELHIRAGSPMNIAIAEALGVSDATIFPHLCWRPCRSLADHPTGDRVSGRRPCRLSPAMGAEQDQMIAAGASRTTLLGRCHRDR